MRQLLRTAIGLAVAALFVVPSAELRAQEYPERPITVVLPMGPGGSHDIHARGITSVLSDVLGQPVIMRFVPGAGGVQGTEAVLAADPDGYTILFSSNGNDQVLPQTREVTYNTLEDLTTLARINMAQPILVAAADAPYDSVEEFVAYAKERPAEVNFGVVGLWGATYVATIQFLQATGIDVNLIPHRGGGDAVQGVLSGQDQITWLYTSPVKSHVVARTMKVLAVAGDEQVTHDPAFSDVPTMAALGYPEVNFTLERVFFAPSAMPADALARLREAFKEIIDHPSFKAYMGRIGEPLHFMSGEEYDALRAERFESYSALIESSKRN